MNVFSWFTLHVDALMGGFGIGKNLLKNELVEHGSVTGAFTVYEDFLVSFFTRKTLITFLPKACLALRRTDLTVTSNLT